MTFENSQDFARQLDDQDPLKSFRSRFIFPQGESREKLYFTGNSLGLQPKGSREALMQELEDWATYGVEGHFEAKHPWFSYHEPFKPLLAEVLGAKPIEVTAMGSLTANLHFLMASFFQPKGKRTKILCEAKAFPSDQYALETQLKFHGLSPAEHLIEVHPRDNEHTIREADIFDALEKYAEEIALVMIGGVNYYTGQVFPMKEISRAAHKAGAFVGFDLAHAAGNVELKLHEWEVDFAAWCSYKYLNSGPGSVGGIFVHEKHSLRQDLPRLAGWWGTPASERFQMKKGFVPAPGADAWQLSNAPVFSMAVHREALELHLEAGMEQLFQKRDQLTAYLDFILKDISTKSDQVKFEIITPGKRGSQLSILTHGQGKALFDKLTAADVVADWREPNVIRLAPVPLYNSFEDVYRLGEIINNSL
jgi:kynureninase